MVEAVAITRHPEKTRHHRGDDAERLHAPDLRAARLIDVDDHPAAVPDRHLLVDGLVGTQSIFEIAADHAIHAQTKPSRFDAELHEALLCHRLVEMSRPLIIGIARGDNVRDRDIGMAAEIDSFHAQNIVAAAPAAGNAGIMVEEIEQAFVVEGCARHADRRVHAQWQSAALGVFTVGADDRGGKPVTLVERGRSRRHIGLCAEANAVRPITVLKARQVAEQGVLQDRHELSLQEHARRLPASILHDLDVVRRGRVARHARAPERQRVGNRRKRTATPPAPHRANIDRVVGSDGIEVMAIWKTAVGQLLGTTDVLVRRFAHGHEHDPLAGGCRLRRTFHDVDDAGDGVKAGDGDAAARLETFPVRVRMRVEKPRQYRTTLKINELRRRSGVFEQRRVVADGRDVTRSHRDGLR